MSFPCFMNPNKFEVSYICLNQVIQNWGVNRWNFNKINNCTIQYI